MANTFVTNFPAASGATCSVEKVDVSGGVLYITWLQTGGAQAIGSSTVFVPTGTGMMQRWLPLTDARDATGVPLTATAASGAMGVSRTAGTSLFLVGEATSGDAKTDSAMWEFNLPSTYVAGSNVAVTVNCLYTGDGTVTAADCTMTVAAYTETNGVEAALTVSAAQQIGATAANKTFTITGTNLTPGQHVAIELTMLITSSADANTGQVNAVSYTA